MEQNLSLDSSFSLAARTLAAVLRVLIYMYVYIYDKVKEDLNIRQKKRS